MRPHTSRNRNAVSRPMPGMSNERAADDGGVSRSTNRPMTRAMMPTGTLMLEARLPVDALDEQPADDGPGRRGGPDHGAPDADGPVQLLDREGIAQQRERGRLEHGAEDAL